MTEEEIKEAYKNYKLESSGFNFDTAKGSLIIYNLIAWFEKKRLKITKIINDRKCITKIIKFKGLDINRYNIQDFYNENLEHKNRKIKIIDFEIV